MQEAHRPQLRMPHRPQPQAMHHPKAQEMDHRQMRHLPELKASWEAAAVYLDASSKEFNTH